jgi:hypothetical protein
LTVTVPAGYEEGDRASFFPALAATLGLLHFMAATYCPVACAPRRSINAEMSEVL